MQRKTRLILALAHQRPPFIPVNVSSQTHCNNTQVCTYVEIDLEDRTLLCFDVLVNGSGEKDKLGHAAIYLLHSAYQHIKCSVSHAYLNTERFLCGKYLKTFCRIGIF